MQLYTRLSYDEGKKNELLGLLRNIYQWSKYAEKLLPRLLCCPCLNENTHTGKNRMILTGSDASYHDGEKTTKGTACGAAGALP